MPRTRADELKGTQWSRLIHTGITEFRKEEGNLGKRRLWAKFDCECGTKGKWIQFKEVKSGKTKSCGCLRKEHNPRNWTKGRYPQETCYKHLYNRYKKSSKQRSIKYLPYEQWLKVVIQECYYCGSAPKPYNLFNEPSRRKAWKGSKSEFQEYEVLVNGVDRYEPAQTYIENSVPCCSVCNVMKGTLTPNEFKEHIEKIIQNGFQAVNITRNNEIGNKEPKGRYVAQVSESGEIINKWFTIKECAKSMTTDKKELHTLQRLIGQVLRGERSQTKGMRFKYIQVD